MASPFSDPPSYPTSSERHSPPLSPSPRVPPILSPDGSHDSFPMRVLPESASSSNPSSEGDQVIMVKKEENASWQPQEDESPVAMDTLPSLPETEETAEPVTSTALSSPEVETKSIPKSVLSPAIILSRKNLSSFASPPSEVKLDQAAAMAAANILMAAASSTTYSEPSVRPVTCEEDTSSSSSPSIESEREQTPPLVEEEPVGKKCRRNSLKADLDSEESEMKKAKRVDLDFSINICEFLI